MNIKEAQGLASAIRKTVNDSSDVAAINNAATIMIASRLMEKGFGDAAAWSVAARCGLEFKGVIFDVIAEKSPRVTKSQLSEMPTSSVAHVLAGQLDDYVAAVVQKCETIRSRNTREAKEAKAGIHRHNG